MLQESLATANLFIRSLLGRYFDVDPNAPIEAWHDMALHHPVFVLTPVPEPEDQMRSTGYPVL